MVGRAARMGRVDRGQLRLAVALAVGAVVVVGGIVLAVARGSDAPVPTVASELPNAGPSVADEEPSGVAAPEPDPRPEPDPEPVPDPEPEPEPDPAPEPEPEPEPVVPPGPPSDERSLELVTTIGGDISPKSVVASDTGVFFAQNMMYRHTITVYDRSYQLLATIPDTVVLEDYGLPGPGTPVRGAPVEMAFTPDGAYGYVSNYEMSGPGFDRPGTDTCSPADGYDDSFVYRVDVASLSIDQVIPVGSVPKYVAVTPDATRVLVSNWCSYDLSIIDTATAQETHRIELGRYPRGIVVDAASETAYIAVMGSFDIAVLDLRDLSLDWIRGIGRSPRHLVLDPDERYLYATLNGEGVVARLELATGDTVKVVTGAAPRSMDIAADGRSLYVVNYNSDTVSKVRTSDMTVLQTLSVDPKPIGITYDDQTGEVWVAHYSGTIRVLRDG